jgi:hypothetical protein
MLVANTPPTAVGVIAVGVGVCVAVMLVANTPPTAVGVIALVVADIDYYPITT